MTDKLFRELDDSIKLGPSIDRLLIVAGKIKDIYNSNNSLNEKQITKIYNWLTTGKSRSFLLNTSSYNPNNDKYQNNIKYIFTKIPPSSKNIDRLLSCYDNNINGRTLWIDVLLENNYNFNDSQKKKIIEFGYDVTKLLKNNDITINEVKELIKTTIKGTTHIDNLKNILKKFNDYTPDLIDFILENLQINNSSYYYSYFVQKLQIIEFFLNYVKPTENTQNILIKNKLNDVTIGYMLLNNGLTPTYELMKFYSTNNKTFELVIHLNTLGIQLTTEVLNLMIETNSRFVAYKFNNNYYYEDIPNTNNIINKLGLTGNDLEKVNIFDVYELLSFLGVKPDYETMKIACSKSYNNIFDDLTKNHQMIPTKEFLDIAIYHKNVELVEKILYYKIIPDTKSFDNLFIKGGQIHGTNTIKIIELLVNFGYMISFNDVEKAIKFNIPIKNLERFNIEYDEKLYFSCFKYCVWPEGYITKMNIDANVLKLRQLCFTPNLELETIKEFMKNKKTPIDRYCLEYAFKYNRLIGQYFIDELKCEPTINILFASSNLWGNSSYYELLDLSNQKLGVDYKYMATQYNIDFEQLID